MRTFAGPIRLIVRLIAVVMSLYHLLIAFIGTPEVFTFRGTHLAFALVLIFFLFPAGSGRAVRSVCMQTCFWSPPAWPASAI